MSVKETSIRDILLEKNSLTYAAYYNGKMSYSLHGKEWEQYVAENFTEIQNMVTSENVFKDVIDLYKENLIPAPKELQGFGNIIVPMLCRGEAVAIMTKDKELHFPEHYEVISDGKYTICAVFSRSIKDMKDYVTFIDSTGYSELYSKKVPKDLSATDRKDYQFEENTTGNALYRFALDDKGFGASLASLQDRINHSIIDQTVVAEMYARPFWYLLNYQAPPAANPYAKHPAPVDDGVMKEQKSAGGSGRIFATSSEGPFGQLDPPTLRDMHDYHDTLISKLSQSFGIPEYFFKPGGAATPPSGTALKILSQRFTNRVSRIRDNISPVLLQMAADIGITPEEGETEVSLWSSRNDLLQDAMDAHGLALVQMGYPLEYIAEVVTPGIDLDDYLDDGFDESRREAQAVAIASRQASSGSGQGA